MLTKTIPVPASWKFLIVHTIPWRGFEISIQNVPDFKLVCSLNHWISDFEQSLKFQLLKNWDYHLTNLGGRGSGILKRTLNILYTMWLLLLLCRNRQSRASVVSMHHMPSLWLHSFPRIWQRQPKGDRTPPFISSFRPPASPSFPFQIIIFFLVLCIYLFVCFTCMGVFPACMSMYHMHALSLSEARRRGQRPWE